MFSLRRCPVVASRCVSSGSTGVLRAQRMFAASLYSPTTFGAIKAANALVMAPMTRTRCEPTTHNATDVMVEYYSQRADAGLLITECSMVTPNTSGYLAEPGLYADSQVEGWKKVTDAVHAKGSKIVMQLWHGGAICCKDYNGGAQAVGPSTATMPGEYFNATKMANAPYDAPRALTDEEAKGIIADFAAAAKRAIAAGFDGIEIHAANGYLINQFLVSKMNTRDDKSIYSGKTIETRAKFLFDVVDACINAIGKDKVGIRLSPYVTYNQAAWDSPEADIAYIATKLNERGIAFIHVMRRDLVSNTDESKKVDATPLFRKHFKGAIITNVGFEREEAEKYVSEGLANAVAIGTPYLANPDLYTRMKNKRDERNTPDLATFYMGGPKGYTDYPTL